MDEEFDLGTIEEADDRCRSDQNKPETESTEKGGDRAQEGRAGGKVKKNKGNLKIKVKTRTWSDVVRGLEGDESETTDSIEKSDMEESNLVKANQTRGKQKSTPIWRNRQVEGRQRQDNEGVDKGLTSKQAD